MENTSKLGVIIPLYNMEQRMGVDTILEILAYYDTQTRLHPHIPICLIDDGSTDKSKELLQFFKKTYNSPLDMIFLEENTKKIGALKAGATHLKTDYILHTDFDSTWELNALENAITHERDFQQDPKLAGMCLHVTPKNKDSLLGKCQELEYGFGRWLVNKLSAEKKFGVIPGAGGLWKRDKYLEILQEHSGEFIGDDAETTLRAIENGDRLSYAQDVIIYTQVPETIKELRAQRQRWIGGGYRVYHTLDTFVKKQFKDLVTQVPKELALDTMNNLIPQKLKDKLPKKLKQALEQKALTPSTVSFTTLTTVSAATCALLPFGVQRALEMDVSNWYLSSLVVNTAIAYVIRKDIDKRALLALPFVPLIQLGLFLTAAVPAYASFVTKRIQDHVQKLISKESKPVVYLEEVVIN